MVGKEPDTGPTARAVAANIRDLREASKMNYTQLSEELQRLGRNINAVGIRRTESGERRVTPDDLSAFAIALNVSRMAGINVPNWNGRLAIRIGFCSATSSWFRAIVRSAVTD